MDSGQQVQRETIMPSLPYIKRSYKDRSQGLDEVLDFRIQTSRFTKIIGMRSVVANRSEPRIQLLEGGLNLPGLKGKPLQGVRMSSLTSISQLPLLRMKSYLGERLDYLLFMFTDALE